MAKEMILKISARTLPNGYALTVNDNEYMAFTPEQFVSMVLYHIGCKELNFGDSTTIECLMEAMLAWPDRRDALMADANLLSQARKAQKECNTAEQARAKAEDKLEDMKQELARMRKEYYELNSQYASLQKGYKDIGKMLVGAPQKPRKTAAKEIKKPKPTNSSPKENKRDTSPNISKFEAQPRALPKHMIARPLNYNQNVEYTEGQWRALTTPIADIYIEGSAIDTRVKQVLTNVGGHKHYIVGDAIIEPRGKLMIMRGVGKKIIQVIDNWLEMHGLEWGMDAQSILYNHSLKEAAK